MDNILLETEERMNKVIENLEIRFTTIRAGRANPAILNKVEVDYYGQPTPINQVASVSVPEARLIVVQPWDKSLLITVQKAIEAANVGINPMNDGQLIRLSFPELTEERRKEIVKDIKKFAEEAKVAIRNVRRDEMDEAKAKLKNNEIRLPVWFGQLLSYIPYSCRPMVGAGYRVKRKEILDYEKMSEEEKRDYIFKNVYAIVKYALENIQFC